MGKTGFMEFAVIVLAALALLAGCASNDDSPSAEQTTGENLIDAEAGPDRDLYVGQQEAFAVGNQTDLTIRWDFGDGLKAEGAEVFHTYKTPGRYTLTLRVTDSQNRNYQDACTIRVFEKDSDGDLIPDSIDDNPKSGDQLSPRESKTFFLKTFDGENIECRIYLPAGEGPYPCFMIAHGWACRMEDSIEHAKLMQSNGYAVLIWSARGWGNSSGKTYFVSNEFEVKDTIMLINWLAEQKFAREQDNRQKAFSDGRMVEFDFNLDGSVEADDIPGDESRDIALGMMGGSYGGSLVLRVASFDRRVDAIAPQETWNDLNSAFFTNGSMKYLLCAGIYAQGMVSVLSGNGLDKEFGGWLMDSFLNNETPDGMEMGMMLRSSWPRIDKIIAPALLLQGQVDSIFDENQAAFSFEGIKANGIPAKMYWYLGPHGYKSDDINDRIVNWMDRYVKGADVDTGAELEYDMVKPDGSRVIASGEWPMVEKADEKKFIFHANSEKAWLASSDSQAALNFSGETEKDEAYNIPYIPASLSGVMGVEFIINIPLKSLDLPLTSSSFTSEPFDEDTEITGIPNVDLWLSSSVDDMTFFVKLYDVAPDGETNAIPFENRAKADVISHLVTPFRIREGKKNPNQYIFDLRGISHIVRAGHSIRLTVSTSDVCYLNSRKAGYGYIWHGETFPSALYLPVVGKPR